jgi:hypothetical protein
MCATFNIEISDFDSKNFVLRMERMTKQQRIHIIFSGGQDRIRVFPTGDIGQFVSSLTKFLLQRPIPELPRLYSESTKVYAGN